MPEDARPLMGRRILVVEDEYFIGLDLKSVLEENGAEVVGPVGTVEAAFDHASRADLSAAVLDVRLRDRSVQPVAECLVSRRIPFIFYSGQDVTAPFDDTEQADAAPAEWQTAPAVSKPAPGRVLVAALCSVLEQGGP